MMNGHNNSFHISPTCKGLCVQYGCLLEVQDQGLDVEVVLLSQCLAWVQAGLGSCTKGGGREKIIMTKSYLQPFLRKVNLPPDDFLGKNLPMRFF